LGGQRKETKDWVKLNKKVGKGKSKFCQGLKFVGKVSSPEFKGRGRGGRAAKKQFTT